jgi:DNA-binding NarL/FixJ family response regulator
MIQNLHYRALSPSYALVLIDIKMPGMSSFELYEELKKIDPDVKVCFLTASEMYHEEVREKERPF